VEKRCASKSREKRCASKSREKRCASKARGPVKHHRQDLGGVAELFQPGAVNSIPVSGPVICSLVCIILPPVSMPVPSHLSRTVDALPILAVPLSLRRRLQRRSACSSHAFCSILKRVTHTAVLVVSTDALIRPVRPTVTAFHVHVPPIIIFHFRRARSRAHHLRCIGACHCGVQRLHIVCIERTIGVARAFPCTEERVLAVGGVIGARPSPKGQARAHGLQARDPTHNRAYRATLPAARPGLSISAAG